MKAILAVVFCASSALAECPVAADLTTGIAVATADRIMRFSRADPATVIFELDHLDDPQSYVYRMWNGVLVDSLTLDFLGTDEPAISYAYSTDLFALLSPPVAGITFDGQVTQTHGSEGLQAIVGFQLTTASRPDLVIGECSYAALAMEQTWVRGDAITTTISAYLPALGIDIIIGGRGPDGVQEYLPLSIVAD